MAAREARNKAAEEQLSALRTQLAQQKAAADGRQASLESQSADLQVRPYHLNFPSSGAWYHSHY